MFARANKSLALPLFGLIALVQLSYGGVQVAILEPAQADSRRLAELAGAGYNGVVLMLSAGDTQIQPAAKQVAIAGLDLYYWIEIARSPALADAHPEWMASVQTHQEWRRFFPDLPALKTNEVVKNYPWVPVVYKETFPVHLQRVRTLLADLPVAKGVFLNDLQGAPSACGCGNPLCRWTPDYGPLTSATRLPNSGAADFVAAVKKLAPGSAVIPVWTTECEELDKPQLCAGVDCFRQTCWREFTAQLMPVVEQSGTIAALLPYKAFQRDLPSYGGEAAWIGEALMLYSKLPLRYQTKSVAPRQIIAVLQGWDVTAAQVQAELARARESGAAGVAVSLAKIEQAWQPRIFNLADLKRRNN